MAGQGHWIIGTVKIVAACAVSLVERLFKIVRPKLLTVLWFAKLWNWFVTVRSRSVEAFS